MCFMGVVSLESGSLTTGFSFTWEFSNFTDAIADYDEQAALVRVRGPRRRSPW